VLPTNVTGIVIYTHQKRRIIIADGHPVMRDGLRAIVEFDGDMEVIGEASNGRAAVAVFATLLPDVILIDVQIQDAGILETIADIRRVSLSGAVVLMSTYSDDATIRQALALGATSCFLKTATGEEILAELRLATALVTSTEE
jgi:DNA-binding NarL/FixJ family response regulator